MKVNHSVITAVLIAAVCACVAWAMNERNGRKSAETQLNANKVLTNPSAKIVKNFTDQLKENHTTFDVTENKVDGKTVAISKPLLDSIAKKSEAKPAEVTDWKLINTATEARALRAEKQLDSVKKTVYFSYRDKNVKLAYHPGIVPDSTGTFDFHYDADLNITSYTRRGKVLGLPFGPKTMFTDIYSNDPRTTIRGLKTFSVQQREPFFGLRIQAVSDYSFRLKTFLIGPGAQLDLGRFSVTGTYLYNPNFNSADWSIGGRYDIFR